MNHPKPRTDHNRAPRPAAPPARPELALEHVDELSRRLRLAVDLDSTGWLRRGVELRYTLAADRSVQPIRVRVAAGATFQELLADGGIVERCASYNRALGALRSLRERAAALVQRGHMPGAPGSATWGAQQELSNLDATIERRQTARMGHGVVSLEILGFETEFLERYHQHLAAIIDSAERAERRMFCQGDTVDLPPPTSDPG